MAGFILDRVGAVCAAGETLEFGDLRFHVTEVKGKRISRVRISRREKQHE